MTSSYMIAIIREQRIWNDLHSTIVQGSGGGQVVGISYAGVNKTDQNFPIGRDEATKIIETLRTKHDIGSIMSSPLKTKILPLGTSGIRCLGAITASR